MSKQKREEVSKLIYDVLKQIDPSGQEANRYKTLFSKMNDKQFEEYMISLRDKQDVIYVNIPSLKKRTITFENNVKVAKKLGIDFFKRLKIVDPTTGKYFLTPHKYAIFHLPVRRQIQTIKSGLSTATDNNTIDPTTGQVVGDSKAASLSTPETFILYSKGLKKSIVELTKVRGGDNDAMRHIYRKLEQTGSATLEEAFDLGTRATSTETLNTYFRTIHIDSNL